MIRRRLEEQMERLNGSINPLYSLLWSRLPGGRVQITLIEDGKPAGRPIAQIVEDIFSLADSPGGLSSAFSELVMEAGLGTGVFGAGRRRGSSKIGRVSS